jgi:hypothetical protein
MIKVFIDGVEHEVKNDVKIVYDNDSHTIANQEVEGHIQITATYEGIIIDLFNKKETELIATQSFMQEDLVNLMPELTD